MPALTRLPKRRGTTVQSGRWVVLAVALGIQAATSIIATSLAVLLPFVKADFHLTFAEAGLVVNFAYIAGFFSFALVGWAVDSYGDRTMLVIGGVLTGVAAIACGLAPSFLALLGTLVVMGVGLAMPTPAGSFAVRSAFPFRLHGMVMGLRQTAFPLGGFLAALILPPIAVRAGWRPAVVAAGSFSVVVAIACLGFYRSAQRGRVQAASHRGGLFSVLTRDLVITSIGSLFLVAGQICLITYLVAYLIRDQGLTVATAALYLALAQLAGVVGRVLWGVVSDRLLAGSRRKAMLLAAGSGALGCLAIAILPGGVPLPLLALLILICSIGTIGWNGVQISYLSELAKPGMEGRSVGLGLMIQQPGILVGPYIFGWVVDTTGAFRPAWFLLAGFLGVAVLIVSVAREKDGNRDLASASTGLPATRNEK